MTTVLMHCGMAVNEHCAIKHLAKSKTTFNWMLSCIQVEYIKCMQNNNKQEHHRVSLTVRVLLTTLDGSLCPGRYFTFSWSVLIISVSLRSLTISSNTHILTVLSNFVLVAALLPMILAMAEPLNGER